MRLFERMVRNEWNLGIVGQFRWTDIRFFQFSYVANWRYRNKFTVERTFAIYSYHLIPYVAFEPYYESQYNKWSTTTEYAGCLLPVGKHVQFNPYYEHENDTGKHPNKQENFIGLAVYFYFSVEKAPGK